MTVTRHGSCPAPDDEGFADFRSMAAMRWDAKRGSKRLKNAILRAQRVRRPKLVWARKSYGTWAERKARFADVRRVQRIVADHFGLPPEIMTTKRGPQQIAEKRQLAMLLARETVKSSYPDIGACFGGMDHSSIIHGCRVAAANASLAKDTADLRERLAAMPEWYPHQ